MMNLKEIKKAIDKCGCTYRTKKGVVYVKVQNVEVLNVLERECVNHYHTLFFGDDWKVAVEL